MEKQIIDRGYVTYALTNENDEIYGRIKSHRINWEVNPIERNHRFYWSEVYCEANHFAMIIRKGKLLDNPSAEELNTLFEQSKINLN